MIRRQNLLWLIIGCLALPLRGQIDYFTPENILRFADHLYKTGDFLLAAAEYQRYTYLQGISDSLRYRIALCRQRGGESETALAQYRQIIAEQPQAPLSDPARYQIAFILTQQGDHRAALDYIEEYSPQCLTAEADRRMKLLANLNRLHMRQWQIAENDLKRLLQQPAPNPVETRALKLQAAAVEGQKITRNSAVLAGIMSAIVPGSGKMYAGRWNDGFYSLILVGLFAYQSCDSFHHHGIESTKAWMYTAVGSVFYLGNIYGSVVAVKIGNQQKEMQVLAKLQVDLSWF